MASVFLSKNSGQSLLKIVLIINSEAHRCINSGQIFIDNGPQDQINVDINIKGGLQDQNDIAKMSKSTHYALQDWTHRD